MTEQTTRRESFVLRIWREGKPPEWRGWVQHAASGEAAYVRRVEELLAFIECRTGQLTDRVPQGLK